jgi:flagellar motility protein MotE (MotC chaperone)
MLHKGSREIAESMFKIVGMILMTIAGFLIYSILFSFAYGLSPADAAKIVITGGLSKDPMSLYQKVVAETDSISAEMYKSFEVIEDSLAEEKRKINAEKAELVSLRDEIARLTELKKKMEDSSLYNLAKIYNDMEPVQLANVMYDLDDTLIVAILPKMKNDKASRILEMLPPDRAARISSMLLGKN